MRGNGPFLSPFLGRLLGRAGDGGRRGGPSPADGQGDQAADQQHIDGRVDEQRAVPADHARRMLPRSVMRDQFPQQIDGLLKARGLFQQGFPVVRGGGGFPQQAPCLERPRGGMGGADRRQGSAQGFGAFRGGDDGGADRAGQRVDALRWFGDTAVTAFDRLFQRGERGARGMRLVGRRRDIASCPGGEGATDLTRHIQAKGAGDHRRGREGQDEFAADDRKTAPGKPGGHDFISDGSTQADFGGEAAYNTVSLRCFRAFLRAGNANDWAAWLHARTE